MGVKEIPHEDATKKVNDIITSKLNVDNNNIDQGDIVAVYRVGQISSDRLRHIVVSFKSNVVKRKVFSNKKALEGSGIVMKEDFTLLRLNMVKEAAERYGFKNVWTQNGNIFAKTEKGVEKVLYNI
nr:unnamed protein product [Callosobruchus chinensis]